MNSFPRRIKNDKCWRIKKPELNFVSTFLADAASIVPSTLGFFLGTSSRPIVDALELKLESDHSDAEDKEQSENSKGKKYIMI